MSRRRIFFGLLIVAVLAGGTMWAVDVFWPLGSSYLQRPPLADTPPLKPNTRTSVMTVPVSVALPAVRGTLDSATPRRFVGKRENPMFSPFGKTDINWTVGRGTFTLAGRPDGLTLSTALSGTLHITEQGAGRKPARSGGNSEFERWLDDVVSSAIEQRGDIRGNAMLVVQPTLMPNWRIDPKLKGQITIADGGLSIAGIAIDISDEVKSAIDRAVRDELGAIQAKLRSDPAVEQAVRREWTRMCRSISLAGMAAGNADVFLEMRPIRAYASQPLIDASAITVTVGIEAQTRIISSATKPDCPFPTQLEIVPPVVQGQFAVAAPIEISFAEINRMLNRQLRGRTFPENGDAAGQITVRRVEVAPSGDRLLITMLVNAREQASWFGLGATAAVYISVRPELDRTQQALRLADMKLDVSSRTAFGLFGAAARAAIPYFEESIMQNAVIDLKPFVASARSGIDAAIATLNKHNDGISADAAVTDLRLVGIEYDSKTLRVIAEAEGSARVAVSKLPEQK